MDRFNGMSVEEVMAKKLPDIITYNLDILIVSVSPFTYKGLFDLLFWSEADYYIPSCVIVLQVGINPGLLSAYKGRHYPNPGNHFCMDFYSHEDV